MSAEQSRDLRSIAHDTKRTKDHNHKWARGNRPASGSRNRFLDGMWVYNNEAQETKIRPLRSPTGKHNRSPNINKTSITELYHLQHKANALVELQDPSNMSRSLHELLPSAYTRRRQSVSDDVLYSFDETESPGKPMSLDVFVKTNTKETEKFVEKEYEILDYNGNAVKGRKALKDVHRGKMIARPEEDVLIEDEGFELV